MPVLLKALTSQDKELSVNAARLLEKLAPLDERVASALVKRMLIGESTIHRCYRISWQTLPLLLRDRLPKPKVSPSLFPTERGDPWYDRAHPCFEALASLISRAYRARTNHAEPIAAALKIVPELCKAVHKKDDWAAARASSILERMGPDAKAAIPDLLEELQNPARHVELRVMMARAIGKIDNSSPEALQCMKNVFSSTTNRILKSAAIAAIGQHAPATNNVKDFLSEVWHGKDSLLSRLAYEQLRKINPDEMKGTVPPTINSPTRSSSGGRIQYRFVNASDDESIFHRFQPR
jgi:hypothetical protein